jgi:UDP-N-acetylglucosamine--N-acetylmuramyl-(pentapeptide) pyrophosphoryl-undecaprenol N-acetylglucosamine transferase
MKHLLIMAAGTGGHIFPGLAIADTMRARGWQVSWLGTQRGMEADIVPKRGIAFDAIDFSGLRGKGIKHAMTGAMKMIASFTRCRSIMRARQPDVVLGMGGYVTVPGGMMAAMQGKPLALMNADAGLLMSNKALLPFAKKILFGFAAEGMQSDKAQVTGNPVRSEISTLPQPAERYAKRVGPLNVLVIGGSLGAKVLNDTVPAALAQMPATIRPNVVHQSGKQHIDALKKNYADAGVEAEVVDFIDDMASRYAAADLVICRAGAITVAELCAAGVASVLVPLVVSTTSHQRNNAQWMAANGAAVHLPQSQMDKASLAALLNEMTRERCLQTAEAAYRQGRRDANDAIAGVLEALGTP